MFYYKAPLSAYCIITCIALLLRIIPLDTFVQISAHSKRWSFNPNFNISEVFLFTYNNSMFVGLIVINFRQHKEEDFGTTL